MGFNYGLEKKRFEAEWARLRKEYAEAGMEAWAIEEMYNFDLISFRRRRLDSGHEQSLSGFQYADEESIEDGKSPLFLHFLEKTTVSDTYSFCGRRFAWIETITDEALYRKLILLSDEDKELVTMLVEDGLSKREIAKIRGVTEQAVGQKIKRLKIFFSDV